MPVVKVKMKYEDEIRRVAGGVRAEADTPWLVVYGSNDKRVARFELDQVRDWWPEDSSSNSRHDAAEHRLHTTASSVRASLDSLLDFSAQGPRAYHHFRSESEQAALKEEAWA